MNRIDLYEKSTYTDSGIRFISIGENSYFPLHWHEHAEIHFMLEGSAQIRCGSKIINFNKNDCVVINSNELHEGMPGPNYKCFKFKLAPSFFHNKYFVFENYIHNETVTDLMYKIIELYQNTDAVSAFKVKSYMYQLATFLCENCIDKNQNYMTPSKEQITKMNAVASYMCTNYASVISTQELANKSHYNYSHFCHVFKEVFGISANRYLLNIRLSKASSLLMTTDMNITEIASVTGFSDSNYFARVFKKENGLSPTEFRNSNK